MLSVSAGMCACRLSSHESTESVPYYWTNNREWPFLIMSTIKPMADDWQNAEADT